MSSAPRVTGWTHRLASASKALLGDAFRITRDRGRFVEASYAPRVLATYHPSAVLRIRDEHARAQMRAALLADLRRATRRARD